MLAGDDGGGGGKKRGSTVARAAGVAALGGGGGEGGGAATLEQLQARQLALFALQKEMVTQLDAVTAALGIGEGGGDADGDGDGDGALADPPKRKSGCRRRVRCCRTRSRRSARNSTACGAADDRRRHIRVYS